MLRPQTWYLVLAAVCTVVCAIVGAGTTLQLVTLLLAAATALAAVPLYKKLKVQAVVCLVALVLLLAWYVQLALYAMPDTMHWQYVLPAVAIILVFLARKGVVHDEKVLRSYDRIR